MAARFWFTNVAASYVPTTKRGAWDKNTNALTGRLGRAPGGVASTANVTTGSTLAAYDVLWGRWISEPAAVGATIAGTAQWVAGMRQGSATANAQAHVHIFVLAGSTDTVRGTLLADSIGATFFPTTATGLTEGAKTLSSVAVQAGDRIVVELGYRASSDTTSRAVVLNYGAAGTVDLAAGGTDVGTAPGWIEFSNIPAGMFDTLTSGLVDTFDDGTIDGPWTTYGTAAPSVVGGRARVPTTSTAGAPNYSGIETAGAYALDDLRVEIPTVPAAAGATSVDTGVIVHDPAQDGAHVGWKIYPVSGTIRAEQADAYWDANATVVPYDPAAHRWFRVKWDGTSVTWQTSPDGTSWATQRTLSTGIPSYVRYGNLSIVLDASRDAGVDDFAEFDNVNTAPPLTVSGTAAVSLPPLAVSSAGTAATSGVSSVALPAVAAAAAATVSATGAATAVLPALTAASAGAASAAGTAALTLVPVQVAGAGTASATGAAALQLQPLTVSGAGSASASGTAAVSLPALQSAGAGSVAGSGVGAVTLPAPTGAGTASSSTTGAGTATLPALTTAGSGTAAAQASGAVTLPALTASGFGAATGTVAGFAVLTLAPLTAAGAGQATATGAAVLSLPAMSAGGTATTGAAAAGPLALPAVTATAAGTASATGSAPVGLPAVQAFGVGTVAELVVGVAALDLPALVAAAHATSTASGAAALALPPLVVAGTDAPILVRRPGTLTAGTGRGRITAGSSRARMTAGAARPGLTAGTVRGSST